MNRRTQIEELRLLESILMQDEFYVFENIVERKIKLVLWLYPVLPKNYIIKYKEKEDSEYSVINLKYLPPIEFYVKIPEGYPSECPPTFSFRCQWLTQDDIIKLTTQLNEIWNDNEKHTVVFAWGNFLKNETLKFLGYDKEIDLYALHKYRQSHQKEEEMELPDQKLNEEGFVKRDKLDLLSCEMPSQPARKEKGRESYKERVYSGFANLTNKVRKITNWSLMGGSSRSSRNRTKADQVTNGQSTSDKRSNLKASPAELPVNSDAVKEAVEVETKLIYCVICFTDFPRKDCFQFDHCNHAYCNACTISYFAMRINDGVHPIKCPELGCPAKATVDQVKDMVSKELFGKYDEVMMQAALGTMGHVVYCPKTTCQYPATKEKEGNLGICPYCQYAFCMYCRMRYHGVEPCKLDDEEKRKLVDRYMSGSKEEQDMLESRFGKTQLEDLINNTLAESWIAENCKNCPKCNVSIEKSEGCNKMICWKCNTYFCWLCSHELERVNPYSHFNDPNSSCSNKLFFLTPLGDDDLDEYNSDDEQWRDWDWI